MIKPREILKYFEPYSVNDYKASIKLDANESPFNLPEELVNRLTKELQSIDFNRYPDALCTELRLNLASRFVIQPDNIFVGNGGDEAIYYVFMAYGGQGRKAVSFTPSFSVYGLYAALSGTEFIEIERDEKFRISNELIDSVAAMSPDIVFLCNPNNPTGTLIPPETVEYLVDNLPDSLIVLDEAYGEFSEINQATFLSKGNVAVLKTFSKAYSLAGMRIGYLLSGKNIIDEIVKVKLPFNVNILSQKLANLCLEYDKYFAEKRNEIVRGRNFLFEQLKNIPGVNPFDSSSNYILFKLDKDAGLVFDALLERGMLIRSFLNDKRINDCLRVTVGTDNENARFINALREIMED